MKKKLILFIFVSYFSMTFSAVELSLENAIELSQKNNLEILYSKENYEEAKIETWNSYKNFLPKLSFQTNFTRYEKDMIGMSIPELGIDTMKKDSDQIYSHTFTITQPIFHGFTLINNTKLMEKNELIAINKIEAKKKEIKLSVTELYLQILKEESLLEIYKNALQELMENDWKLTQKYNSGIVSKNSLSEMKYKIAELESETLNFEMNIKTLKMNLKNVMGVYGNEEIILKKIQDGNINLKMIKLDSDIKYISQNPDYKILDLSKEQLKLQEEIAFGKMLPNIDFIYTNSRKDSWFPDSIHKRDPWSVSLNLSVDLWDFADKYDNYKLAQVRSSKQRYAETISKNKIENELKTLYYELIKKQKFIEARVEAVSFADEKYKIEKEKFTRDLSTFSDYLSAENDLRKYKTELSNAKIDMYNIYIKYLSIIEG